MSDVLQSSDLGAPRQLRADERAILNKLLSRTALAKMAEISDMLVQDMPDGGMGSIHFCRTEQRSETRPLAKQIAEGTFKDRDGTPVSITLNVDDRGELLELDVFKGDGSPLVSYPDPQDVEVIEPQG
jgi:uncharacterized protein DUF6984